MKRSQMRHPEEEQLLRYSDGELPARTSGEVRSHVEACWDCRVVLEEMQETVSQCVRYRKNVLERHLPPPPAPWIDIYRGFAEIDASMKPAFFSRVKRVLAWPANAIADRRGWALAAVALAVGVGLVSHFRQTPSVEAAELLQKAVVAAHTNGDKPRKIQIRTRDRSLVRPAGVARTVATSAAENATASSLEAMFVAANYDWADPLSAKAYQAWRERLTDKQDEVVSEQGSYRVRTSTASGDLVQATLKLRTEDLRPVEERLEFRNRDWVEITEVSDDDTPRQETAGAMGHATDSAPAQSHETTASETSIAPGPTATIGDELRVMAALHQLGADLGDPVEVSLSGNGVLVSGVGITPQRQEEIKGALSSNPNVVVRFSESAPAKAPATRAAVPDASVSADIRQLQSRIAEQLGGRTSFEQLAAQLVDLSEPLMSRAYALRRLAEQFPVGVESQLSSADRQLLRNMRREHTSALRQSATEIERLVTPVLTSIGGAAPAGAVPVEAWQSATEELFQSARRLDKLLAVVFGSALSDTSGEQLAVQLRQSLAKLRAQLDSYDRSDR